MSKNKKGKAETFPKITPQTATNEVLLDEFLRASSGAEWATTSAQIRHYEEYASELKAEILRRMTK